MLSISATQLLTSRIVAVYRHISIVSRHSALSYSVAAGAKTRCMITAATEAATRANQAGVHCIRRRVDERLATTATLVVRARCLPGWTRSVVTWRWPWSWLAAAPSDRMSLTSSGLWPTSVAKQDFRRPGQKQWSASPKSWRGYNANSPIFVKGNLWLPELSFFSKVTTSKFTIKLHHVNT